MGAIRFLGLVFLVSLVLLGWLYLCFLAEKFINGLFRDRENQ